MKNLVWITVIVVGLTIAVPGFAERNPREAIEAYRIWKLTEVLDLSDEQMPLFFSKLREIDDMEATLRREELDALRDIKRLLAAKDVDEKDLESALDRYIKARKRRTEEVAKLRQEAMEMLNLRQRCQYVVFEERFRQDIRDLIEKSRRLRRSGQSGGPGDGPGFGGMRGRR